MTVTLEEAKRRLDALIAKLSPGEELLITVDDFLIARLTKEYPPLKKPRVPGSAKETIVCYVDDDEHLKDFAEYM